MGKKNIFLLFTIGIILLSTFFLIQPVVKPKKDIMKFDLEVGDILFQDLDSSPLCDAIEIVTPGYQNSNLSHIGIIIETGNNKIPNHYNEKSNPLLNTRVLEAIPGGVKSTRLDSFLNQSLDDNGNPKVLVGRLKSKYSSSIPNAVKFCQEKIGFEYDNDFLLNNNKYYCSELIFEAFKKDSIFKLNPMTFINPNTNKTMSVWKTYYDNLKMDIPENELGINPGSMSLSNKITIVHKYGELSTKE